MLPAADSVCSRACSKFQQPRSPMLRQTSLSWSCSKRFSTHRIHSGRHPDYIRLNENPLQPVEVRDRHDLEADIRYRRVDYSVELASEARYEFARCLAAGEASIPLARAALLVAAEDDAIASSSTVRFPVDAFLNRITRLAEDLAQALAAAAAAAAATAAQQVSASSSSSSSSGKCQGSNPQWAALQDLPPEQIISAVEYMLFNSQQQQQQQQWYRSVTWRPGFSMPSSGRTNLPSRTLVDHPGVWEDARLGYLNEVIVKKQGCAAALVILYAEIMQQLLLMGAIDFTVTFEYNDFNTLPHAVPLSNVGLQYITQQQPSPPPPPAAADIENSAPLPSSSSSSSRARLLNTCSSDALAEVLRHLKRSYWPFPWDTNIDDPKQGGQASLGGFRGAAKAALGSSDISAALRAVSATAQHRLQRGIWTSPGGGDLVRCVAAAERLVMMVGEQQPAERRDLAVLLLHAGQPSAAAAELTAYFDSVKSSGAAADPFDMKLANDLWKLISQDNNVTPDREVITTDLVLRRGILRQADDKQAHKPLTW